MKSQRRKQRLYGNRKVSMPTPRPKRAKQTSFELRLISEADSRYAVVKTMKARLQQLMADAGIDSIQQEWLAARAVFLVSYLESMEVAALEGTKIDWRIYVLTCNALSGILCKLGVEKDTKANTTELRTYIAKGERRTGNG